MVKLLHIGIETGKGKWLDKELRQRTDYAEINPHQSDVHIKSLFDSHKPECVFMQIQQADAINIALIKYMSERAILINWSGDVRDPIPEWFYDVDQYCITCFSNMRSTNI